MNYPGGKNGGGAYQKIINLIPPHKTYVEPFCGSAAVWRHKLPARQSILIDRHEPAVHMISYAMATRLDQTRLFIGDAFDYLPELSADVDTFIYADPPYLPETRTKKKIYEHEMTFEDHVRLLEMLNNAASMVAISGYPSALYESCLFDWNCFEYDAMTRGHTMRRECIWYNYDTPKRLHDYRYLGRNRTDRQRIRKKVRRLHTKLAALPEIERNAVIDGILHTEPSARSAKPEPSTSSGRSAEAKNDCEISRS